MLQWLKPILGDAYTDEIDTSVFRRHWGAFCGRADFNTKTQQVTELETEVAQLSEGIKTRDTQLSGLEKSPPVTMRTTKQTPSPSRTRTRKPTMTEELAQVKLMAAVVQSSPPQGPRINTAVRAMLAGFSLKDAKVVDGKVTSMVGNHHRLP